MTEAPPPPSGDDSSTGSTPPPDAPTPPPSAPSPPAPPAAPYAPPGPPSAPPSGGLPPPPPPPPGDGGFGAPPPQPYGSQPAFGSGYSQPPAFGGQAPGGAYAEWPQRVLGALIDAGILIGGYIIVFIVAAILGQIADGLGFLVIVVGYLGVLGLFIWNQVIVQGNTGQSIGKKQIGIKLIAEQTGAPLGPGLTFVRQIAHILDSICMIGYLWPLWDAKKQTFADKIMTSIVIKT